jgi:hypothetical protein
MKTKNTPVKGRIQIAAPSPAVQLFNEIRRSLHGIGGDVKKWLLPPLDKKKNPNSIEPNPGPIE